MGISIVDNFIGGKFTRVVNGKTLPVENPATGEIISSVSLSGMREVGEAVKSAQTAFPIWSTMPIKERAQVFYRYKSLLENKIEELSRLVTLENGKILSEARAEVEKSIEVTEFACSMPQMTSGEILEVSRGVECRSDRYPVGIVACITPFNFPTMVPHWTIPNALILGNCMILKPSELVQLSAIRIGELLQEAG